MSTFIYISLALLINFYSPKIPENKKAIKNNDLQNKIITGFPYQYFKGEILTDEMVTFRIRRIYIYFMICITVTFSVGPILQHTVFISTSTPTVMLIPNQFDSQINKQELLVDLRGGDEHEQIKRFVITLIYILREIIAKSVPAQSFQPKPSNPHFSGPRYVQQNPRIASKLQENPVDRNNRGNMAQGSCSRSNKHLSMDQLANSLSLEYVEYQNKYYSKSLPKRFDTRKFSVKEFKKLARDTGAGHVKYTRVSIDEARAAVQAKLANLIIEPTRPDTVTAKSVDLDYQILGPAPFTHLDIKTPVGSEILRKQNRTVSVEEMSYEIGRKIVEQKHRFVGKENGPASSENVCHIVDLCYVPIDEKALVRSTILKGARDQGSDTGILFLNDE